MKLISRIFLILFVLLVMVPNAYAIKCDQFVLKYNTAVVVHTCLGQYDSTNTDDNEKVGLKTNATFSAGDVKIEVDIAGAWDGEANIGTLPTDRGSCYSQPISAAETSVRSGYITYVDQDSAQAWVAHCIEFRTYGDTNAFYPTLDTNIVQVSGDAGAADNLETMLDGTGGQTLSLGKLAVVATTGDAVVVSTAGGNGDGMDISGNGSGMGILVTAGVTGDGIKSLGGSTSGAGGNFRAPTSGNGMTLLSAGGGGSGLTIIGAGSGPGMLSTGGSTGPGVRFTGGSTSGAGITATNTTGDVVSITGVAGNANAVTFTGQGSGSGFRVVAGATGNGAQFVGGSTSGDAINGSATAGDGFDAVMGTNNIIAATLATDTITAAKIATDAIGAAEVAADAITNSEVASSAVTEIQLGLNPLEDGTAQAVGTNTMTIASVETYQTNALRYHNSVWVVNATNGKGQLECICGNSNVDVVTLCRNWPILPTGAITYKIVKTPNCDPRKWPISR